MAVVLVGAMIVGGIETPWSGRLPRVREPTKTSYVDNDPEIKLGKGEECGRFLLGSTVVCLFPPQAAMTFNESLVEGSMIRVGQLLGEINA